MKNETSLFSRILGYFFFVLNLVAILWLGACAIAAHISPEDVEHVGLVTLTTPFAIVVNFIFVIAWLFSARKLRSLWSFITLAACYKIVLQVFAFHMFTTTDFKAGPNGFKFMSWNVHGMGVFDKPRNNDHADGIIDVIQKESPDILSLIEYPASRSKDSLKLHTRRIMQQNGYTEYKYRVNDPISPTTFVGVGIFSRFPVSNYKTYQLANSIHMLQWDVTFPGNKIIRMFFLHLSSFDLSQEDRIALSEMKSISDVSEKQIDYSRSFVKKFDRNYINRTQQMALALPAINESPYPVIISGDFNDLPGSYIYNGFRDKRCDAFVAKGFGLGRTFNQISPTLRIDHIFYDCNALQVTGYKAPSYRYSDHNPVIAIFEVK